jgi:hypothetical protein
MLMWSNFFDDQPSKNKDEFAKVVWAVKPDGFGSAHIGGKEYVTAMLPVKVRTGILLHSTQTREELDEAFKLKSLEERKNKLEARLKELEKLVGKTRDDSSLDEIVDEMIRLAKEVDSISEAVYSPPAVAEGVLTTKGPLPGPLLFAGSIRPHDPKGKDKLLPLGTAIVEGKADAGHRGKDGLRSLRIRNGDTPILVTGRVPPAPVEMGRRIRVQGELRLVGGKRLIIDAHKVEFVSQ